MLKRMVSQLREELIEGYTSNRAEPGMSKRRTRGRGVRFRTGAAYMRAWRLGKLQLLGKDPSGKDNANQTK